MRTTAEYTKPLPAPNSDTQPFWDGCRAHELRAQRCTRCGTFRWPPRALCARCQSWDSEWVRLAGTGRVDSYVVVHHVTNAAFADDVPYAVAHVTLDGTDEQVRILSNVVGVPPERVSVGMHVEVVFDDVTAEVTLPKFRPA